MSAIILQYVFHGCQFSLSIEILIFNSVIDQTKYQELPLFNKVVEAGVYLHIFYS